MNHTLPIEKSQAKKRAQTKDKSLPDESPIIIAVDSGSNSDEQEKEEAFEGIYHWKDQELRPYTPSARGTWERLCALDVPLPAGVELNHLEAYAPQAMKLIYLLSHPAESYAHLRGKPELFLAEVERWVDATCQHSDMIEGVILALRIHNDAMRMIAIPKPTGKGQGTGN